MGDYLASRPPDQPAAGTGLLRGPGATTNAQVTAQRQEQPRLLVLHSRLGRVSKVEPVTDGPSRTAQRVAAYRLDLERVPAPYGDPVADQRLSAEVARWGASDTTGSGQAEAAPLPSSEPLARHLSGRTAFFDKVTVGSLERGIDQVTVIGAGYDGRCLRYAKPGVRWWEVDQPDTSASKRQVLAALGIVAPHVSFVTHDLRDDGLGQALASAGLEPDRPSLHIVEGVAVYLAPHILEAVLDQLRHLSQHPGTRLAISLSAVPGGSPESAARRQQFEEGVAALGEPAHNSLNSEDGGPLFARAGWHLTASTERAWQAGFVIAVPN